MRHKILSLLLAALAASLAACGDDDDDDNGTPVTPYQDDARLTVMTRNLYLGAGLEGVIQAGQTGNATAVALAATQAWALVNTNSFETRAAAIAAEAAATLPDVIGLQEVTHWLIDAPADGPASRAEDSAIDYLGLLLARLRERGLEYVPAATPLELFDVEAPTAFGYDARLLDRQVILVRAGVPFANARSGVFTTLLPEQLPGTGAVRRGWTAVDVTIGGQPITVFNTHLEAFGPDILRQAQAGELAGIIGAGTGRIVLVGDLNSVTTSPAYGVVTGPAGFSDAWATLHAGEDGFTCCWPGDLRLTTPGPDQRIDYVLTRGDLTPLDVTLVGEDPADRIASPFGPLWPTDHVGVVATLEP